MQKAVESEVTSTSAPPEVVAEPAAGEVMHIDFSVGGMTCAHCPPLVAKALKQVEGVVDARVNLATQTASVDFAPSHCGHRVDAD
jgi:Cu+-exporting ATPase